MRVENIIGPTLYRHVFGSLSTSALPFVDLFATQWFNYYWLDGDIFVSAVDYQMPKIEVSIRVTYACAVDSCLCSHSIAGNYSQLLPRRVFTEAFLRGTTDTDWEYLMYGSLFGFKITDNVAGLSYAARTHHSPKVQHHSFISEKLNKELASGYISWTASPIVHIICFAYQKNSGAGFHLIIVCSKPLGHSVNKKKSTTSERLSYNSVNTLKLHSPMASYFSNRF